MTTVMTTMTTDLRRFFSPSQGRGSARPPLQRSIAVGTHTLGNRGASIGETGGPIRWDRAHRACEAFDSEGLAPIGREDSGWEILLLEDRHRAQMCFWATTADRKVGLAQGSKVLVTRCGDPALSVSARPPTHWAVEHSSAND